MSFLVVPNMAMGSLENLFHKFSKHLIKKQSSSQVLQFFFNMNKLMFSMNDQKHYNKHFYFLYRSVMRLGPIPEVACLYTLKLETLLDTKKLLFSTDRLNIITVRLHNCTCYTGQCCAGCNNSLINNVYISLFWNSLSCYQVLFVIIFSAFNLKFLA